MLIISLMLSKDVWNSVPRVTHDKSDVPLPSNGSLEIGFNGNDRPYGFWLSKGQDKDVAYFKIFFSSTPIPDLEHIKQDPISEAKRSGDFYPDDLPAMPALSWGVKTIEVVHCRRDSLNDCTAA